MLNSMSFYYSNENLDIFFDKYKKSKQSIFGEIFSYLGGKGFKSKENFKKKFNELLSKEGGKKVLSSGLILKINKYTTKLELTDEESSFTIFIEFLALIKFKDKMTNKEKFQYIISQPYFDYYYRKLKKNKIKYKFNNNPEEESSITEDFEEEVIYNQNLEYISINPNFDDIYSDIFNILKEKKELKGTTPKNILNDYTLLNFPEIIKEKKDKIKFKPVDFIDYCFDYIYLCYNKKIGLTLYTHMILMNLFKKNKKFFYCNMDFLTKEVDLKKIRNYLFFYLSFLFEIDGKNGKNNFKDFIENNVMKLIYTYKGEELIMKILVLLHEKFNDFTFYIDNVKTSIQFNLIKNFIDTYRKDKIYVLIQINQNTLDSLLKVHYILLDNLNIGHSLVDDLEYYISINQTLTNENKIKEEYSNKLKKYFENFNYESYINLLKLKYLINVEHFELKKLKDIQLFLDFILVKFNEKEVKKICFRNDLIKSIFNDNYINYTSKFINKNDEIFYDITKSEEGINLERQIIYDLIVNNLNVTKIKIKQIFCIKSFPIFEYNIKNDYIFIQTNSNAPYYDIAYLYHINGITILKICQIGINKKLEDLIKLNRHFILFDISYFCERLKYEKKIQIDKIEICIITTYNGYIEYEQFLNNKISAKDRKYPNFDKMKTFCNDNKYTFLIYNTRTSNFYSYNNNNILEPCNFQLNTLQYNVINIFKKPKYINKYKRIYYRFNPQKNIIGKIKLLSNNDRDKLNKEYKFKIIKNIAIFKKNLDSSNTKLNDNNINENKIINENNNEIVNIEKMTYINKDNIIDSENIKKENNIEEDVTNIIKNNKYEKELKKEKDENIKLLKKRFRNNNDNTNDNDKNKKKKNK